MAFSYLCLFTKLKKKIKQIKIKKKTRGRKETRESVEHANNSNKRYSPRVSLWNSGQYILSHCCSHSDIYTNSVIYKVCVCVCVTACRLNVYVYLTIRYSL